MPISRSGSLRWSAWCGTCAANSPRCGWRRRMIRTANRLRLTTDTSHRTTAYGSQTWPIPCAINCSRAASSNRFHRSAVREPRRPVAAEGWQYLQRQGGQASAAATGGARPVAAEPAGDRSGQGLCPACADRGTRAQAGGAGGRRTGAPAARAEGCGSSSCWKVQGAEQGRCRSAAQFRIRREDPPGACGRGAVDGAQCG